MSASSILPDIAAITPEYRKMPYWFNVLLAIDQLGNAITDGNPDDSISARVGYFASDKHPSRLKTYWKTLERIIDFTFEPVEGPGHCYNAWLGEMDESDDQGSYPARIILCIFVAAGCIVSGAVIRLAVFINPRLRKKYEALRHNCRRQSRMFAMDQHPAPVEP